MRGSVGNYRVAMQMLELDLLSYAVAGIRGLNSPRLSFLLAAARAPQEDEPPPRGIWLPSGTAWDVYERIREAARAPRLPPLAAQALGTFPGTVSGEETLAALSFRLGALGDLLENARIAGARLAVRDDGRAITTAAAGGRLVASL